MTITITCMVENLLRPLLMDEVTYSRSCPSCRYALTSLSDSALDVPVMEALTFPRDCFTFFAPTSVGTLESFEWVFGSSQRGGDNFDRLQSRRVRRRHHHPPPVRSLRRPQPLRRHGHPPPLLPPLPPPPRSSSTTSSVPPSTSSSATTTTPSSSSVPSTGPTPADGAEALYELGTVLAQLSTFVEQIVFHAE
jgi:hypothetical protein